MKLIGAHNQKKKDGSNSNSSRTSPSRMEDSEFVKNSLLASSNGDFVDEAATSLEIHPIQPDSGYIDSTQTDANLLQSKELGGRENGEAGNIRLPVVSKGDFSNSSSVHPVRTCEDENLDYDSTSSFEFHKGERSSLHHSVSKSLSRPMSSKWNDAEKWIMNRQIAQSHVSKKNNVQNLGNNRALAPNSVRVAPESTSSEHKPSVKRVDFCQPPSLAGSTKFGGFPSRGPAANSGQVSGGNSLVDLRPESMDLAEVDGTGLPCTKNVTDETSGIPAIRSVSMRDMGTEMTPIPSQEPSRSATPVSSTTPIRSPTSSMPSTPRRGEPAPTPAEHFNNNTGETGKTDLSEQELKLKTRREIEALGVQLGKMKIAAWASKDEKELSMSGNEAVEGDELEYEKRAAAWEEAEKSKHAARFKREEIRIQAWESQQRAKLEAEMRKIEAEIEQKRVHAQAKMVKKIALARQKSEKKRAAAEARRNRQAEKTTAQAECIRQTGRIPPSSPFICCGWS
ncbi:uncharacterized protein LOC127249463 isoform X2 [Andrographis paniculata]|nr:uncharacterized protein LOC127249463 isoform X2 [Andrographis paniculata]